MIKFNHKKETDDEVKVNLMPLIDIIFNLLIFFMITAAITTKGISIDLPEAKTSEKMPIKSWEIVINENQEILFNEIPITMNRLELIMKEERALPEKEKVANVILKAHPQAPFGIFVKIMDMARENNFLNLVIATESVKERKNR